MTDIPWLELGPDERCQLRDAVARVLSTRPWVKAAYLYGSVARARGPARDIDVGIVAAPVPRSWKAEAQLAAEIAAAAGRSADELDVRILNGGDPVFLHGVLADGQLLYEGDREARIRFEVRAMSQWLDFRPVWERMRARVLQRWSGE